MAAFRLQDVVQHAEVKVEDGEHHYPTTKQETSHLKVEHQAGSEKDNLPKRHRRRNSYGYDGDDPEAAGLYQPTFWWFSSTAFPLFAGTFGPVANLFSVCALSQSWRLVRNDERRVPDPTWLIIMNSFSLFCALLANLSLLFNFARRVRYSTAQPITITFWYGILYFNFLLSSDIFRYISCILLLIPIGVIHHPQLDPSNQFKFSQSYYYAMISCILYFCISTLLLFSTLGAVVFHAYRPSFSILTGPQRTLMLQTISFTLYLALGAGVFARIENWGFSDGVYWADYTLLTIGLGSDFPLTRTSSRMILIPYAALGITLLGLVINSVRGLVLERAKVKVVRRHLGREREKWKINLLKRRRHAATLEEIKTPSEDSRTPLSPFQRWRKMKKEQYLTRLPRQFEKQAGTPFKKEDHVGPWHRAEFELMRFIEAHVEATERYTALSASFTVVALLWFGGSLIFWSCEHKSQGWTYPPSHYRYGDFYPTSTSGKPFFVLWSLISIPAMTVLISNMADTVVQWVEQFTLWFSSWTILPERKAEKNKKNRRRKRRKRRRSKSKRTRQGVAHSTGTDSTDRQKRLGQDVERIGSDIEHFEEEEGREGSPSARLAREIAILAKDMRVTPPKKYTWQEWWDRHSRDRQNRDTDSADAPTSAPIKTPSILSGAAPAPGHSLTIHVPEPASAHGEQHNDDWEWTWLGDHGPLLSNLTETEWIIEKLCFRLEEVLEEEIMEAREQTKVYSGRGKDNDNEGASTSASSS
ncbi:hypothetical protein CPB84DRAFT_1779259 [Gymnopilus junonius]|uniref:Potassium channel domain-containing protein n=1 Tax=Gymnopilus junonius TaxID=109634 RepID=A0A9P5TNQ9_GYMJU|nr:hypothetical protein CPB84DRAFT_1779259 [Gymnopilus junonius]